MSFHPNEIARRGRFASVGLIVLFGVLAARFFSMQVLQHAEYVLRSDRNRLNEVPLPAPRGIVYDRNGVIIAENVPGFTVSILAPREDSLNAALARLSERIPLTQRQVYAAVVRHRESPNRPTVLFADAPFDVVSVLEEHRVEFPGLIIQSAPKRHYPDSTIVSAFIGYTGDIDERDLDRDTAHVYKAGQIIGKTGLEREYETQLRGQEGSRFVEVDAKQRVVRDEGVRAELPPVAGPALKTNIDMDLQRFVAGLFADSLVGAAIALDPSTGGVLALLSAPGYDPNRFVGGLTPQYMDTLNKDPRRPLVNKAVQDFYPPGSTWKLATAIIGLQKGVVSLDDKMPKPCDGTFPFGDRVWHCWEKDGHGAVDLIHAIEKSCDVYFYQLGLKIGLANLVSEGRAMLFGDTTGIDLPNEHRPDFPDPNPSLKAYFVSRFGPNGYTPQARAINMAIGQDANSQTVINMARFYTALATDGQAATPSVAQRNVVRKRLFQIPTPELDSLRMAMSAVVSSAGTAASAAIKGIALAGKTGSAQTARGRAAHGWFVGFAPVDQPKIVVAVLLEFGEHGDRAARIASKIVEHYLKAAVVAPAVTGDD